MSSLNLKEVFSAKEARAESFSNNPYEDELYNIMKEIKECTNKGKFEKIMNHKIEFINKDKLQDLGYDVTYTTADGSKTYIRW